MYENLKFKNILIHLFQKNIVKRWLAIPENRVEISGDQLQIILDQVNHNEIGIHGSGIFTITYALVASVSDIIYSYGFLSTVGIVFNVDFNFFVAFGSNNDIHVSLRTGLVSSIINF